jgi:hypothetical protein
MESITSRIAALGAPRGIQVLLADLANCHPNDVTNWIKGRQVSEHRRLALEGALTTVERVYAQPIRPELTVGNVRRAALRLALDDNFADASIDGAQVSLA